MKFKRIIFILVFAAGCSKSQSSNSIQTAGALSVATKTDILEILNSANVAFSAIWLPENPSSQILYMNGRLGSCTFNEELPTEDTPDPDSDLYTLNIPYEDCPIFLSYSEAFYSNGTIVDLEQYQTNLNGRYRVYDPVYKSLNDVDIVEFHGSIWESYQERLLGPEDDSISVSYDGNTGGTFLHSQKFGTLTIAYSIEGTLIQRDGAYSGLNQATLTFQIQDLTLNFIHRREGSETGLLIETWTINGENISSDEYTQYLEKAWFLAPIF